MATPSYISSTFTPWQTLPPMGVGQPGAPVQGGGGGDPQPFFRDAMDARRSAWGSTPEAQYPAGYLGTIRPRREDRLLDNIQGRQTDRAYTRGVHRGERIPPQSYFWPEEFNPEMGLKLQAEGRKFAPLIDTQAGYGPRQAAVVSAQTGLGVSPRAKQLRSMGPSWR